MNTTKILGEAVGIQRQDIIDRTEEQTADGLTGAVILGRFKRGRVDAPMEIHQGNIRGQLGYDPKNPDYIAVQDCLDTDVLSVQVLRIGSKNNDNGGESHPPISCAGATQEAILSGINIINGWTKPVTVDIYVNNILVAADITASYINQYWTSIDALKNNAETLGYYVSGDSSRQETFYNPSASNITFSFVPKSDGIYSGTTYFAKDVLTISANNSNPTAYKDPATGTLSFCLAATDNSPTFESSKFMTTVNNTYSPHNSAYVMCKISDINGVTLAQVDVHSLEDTDYSFNGAISVAIDKLKENTEIASYIDISHIQNAVTETHIDILVQNKTSIDLRADIEFQAESSVAYVINANLRGNV